MRMSEQIDQIAPALVKATAEIKPAIKDSTNPAFKSRYADLGSCIDACRDALAKNGLALLQPPAASKAEDVVGPDGQIATRATIALETIIVHTSGQWIGGEIKLPLPLDGKPQAIGSLITYMRRYTLCALLGIATEDDDGNQANGTTSSQGGYSRPANPAPNRDRYPSR